MSTADSLGFWDLPEPEKDKNAEKEWLPIPKVAVTIPFGYKLSEDLNALEKAKLHLRQYSYREVSMWLTKTTGRYISHIGLNKRINNERKRKKQAEAKRQWAKRYKEAIEAAEKLETQRVGAYREQAAAAS